MKTDMNFTGVSDDDYNVIFNVLVKANKRRAKERVRQAKIRTRLNWLYENVELIIPIGMCAVMIIYLLFVLAMEAAL